MHTVPHLPKKVSQFLLNAIILPIARCVNRRDSQLFQIKEHCGEKKRKKLDLSNQSSEGFSIFDQTIAIRARLVRHKRTVYIINNAHNYHFQYPTVKRS